MTGKTDREKLKEQLGKAIREIAEGFGALQSNSLMNSQEKRCADDFEEEAGKWVYELLKKATQYYAGNVQEGPREASWPECPNFINVDNEEDWAGVIYSDVVEKHIRG